MQPTLRPPLRLDISVEQWDFRQPVRITGHVITGSTVVVVNLDDGVHHGRGEALGVRYRGESVATMRAQIEALRPRVEAGIDRTALQRLLPCGGARNALDCALWDLQARRSGIPAWQQAGLGAPQPLVTTFTVGVDTPRAMADASRAHAGAREIKIKLDGAPADRERVHAIRDACPAAVLLVDANEGWTLDHLRSLLPDLQACGVALIEQPLPAGRDAELAGFESPIPIGADESIQGLGDLETVAHYYSVINLKLDKTGGLTEALAIAARAHQLGLSLMVGCMGGTSLSMAPAYLLGQLCRHVDLDGPAFLLRDREPSIRYVEGAIVCPPELWG